MTHSLKQLESEKEEATKHKHMEVEEKQVCVQCLFLKVLPLNSSLRNLGELLNKQIHECIVAMNAWLNRLFAQCVAMS